MRLAYFFALIGLGSALSAYAGPTRKTFVTEDAIYVVVTEEYVDIPSDVMLKRRSTLFKFDKAGKPDTNFGRDGKVRILGDEKNVSVEATDVRIGADGKIYIGGNFASPNSERRETKLLAIPGSAGAPLGLQAPPPKLLPGPESTALTDSRSSLGFPEGERFDKVWASIQESQRREAEANSQGRVEARLLLPPTTDRESRAGFVNVLNSNGQPVHSYGQSGTGYFPLQIGAVVTKVVPHSDGRATVGVERQLTTPFGRDHNIDIVTLDSLGREVQTTTELLRTDLPGLFFERNTFKENSEEFARPTLGLEIGGLRDIGPGMELYANRLYREAPGKPLILDTGFVQLDHLFPDDYIRSSSLSPVYDLQFMGLDGNDMWGTDTIPFRFTIDAKGVGIKHLNGKVRPLSTNHGPYAAVGIGQRVSLLKYVGTDESQEIELPKEMKSLQGVENSGNDIVVWGNNGKRVIVTKVDPVTNSVVGVTKTAALDCPLDLLP